MRASDETNTIDTLATVFAARSRTARRIAADDRRLGCDDSAAYQSGIAYAYQVARADLLAIIASRPQVRKYGS